MNLPRSLWARSPSCFYSGCLRSSLEAAAAQPGPAGRLPLLLLPPPVLLPAPSPLLPLRYAPMPKAPTPAPLPKGR